MKANELRDKSVSDLKNRLLDLLKEQFNLRMQKSMSESSARPHQFKAVRREIARIKTIIKEKE